MLVFLFFVVVVAVAVVVLLFSTYVYLTLTLAVCFVVPCIVLLASLSYSVRFGGCQVRHHDWIFGPNFGMVDIQLNGTRRPDISREYLICDRALPVAVFSLSPNHKFLPLVTDNLSSPFGYRGENCRVFTRRFQHQRHEATRATRLGNCFFEATIN